MLFCNAKAKEGLCEFKRRRERMRGTRETLYAMLPIIMCVDASSNVHSTPRVDWARNPVLLGLHLIGL